MKFKLSYPHVSNEFLMNGFYKTSFRTKQNKEIARTVELKRHGLNLMVFLFGFSSCCGLILLGRTESV